MNDAISGVAGQFLQQLLENQSTKQQTQNVGKRSFESYLQQDKTVQTEQTKVDQTNVKTEQSQPNSISEKERYLEQLQTNLAQTNNQKQMPPSEMNKMLSEMLEGKSGFGNLLKEAYSKVGNTSKVTNDLSGTFVRVEGEINAVEEIMHSNKNLSTGELLALQARLYQVSQHIEVMSKVVDQMAGGIKTVLNTNV